MSINQADRSQPWDYAVRVVRDAENILPAHEVVVEQDWNLRERLQDLIEQR